MTVLVEILKEFKYAFGGLRLETLHPGQKHAIDENMVDGLVAEGFCKVSKDKPEKIDTIEVEGNVEDAPRKTKASKGPKKK